MNERKIFILAASPTLRPGAIKTDIFPKLVSIEEGKPSYATLLCDFACIRSGASRMIFPK